MSQNTLSLLLQYTSDPMKPAGAGGVAGGGAKATPTGDSQHAQGTGSSGGGNAKNANNNAQSSSSLSPHAADGHSSPHMRNTATALSVAVLALKNPGWEGLGNLPESSAFEPVRTILFLYIA